MKKIILPLFILIVFTTSFANAWDGKRQGFLLGLGFGGGYNSFTGIQYDPISSEKTDNATFAYAASPRIGYAFNNQLAFYYSRHPIIFSLKNENDNDVKITSCIESLMAHYYLTDAAPSLYFGAGAGVGYFFDEDTSNYSKDALKGIGVIGTVGFEPIKHMFTELSLHYRSPQKGASDFSISILIGVLGY